MLVAIYQKPTECNIVIHSVHSATIRCCHFPHSLPSNSFYNNKMRTMLFNTFNCFRFEPSFRCLHYINATSHTTIVCCENSSAEQVHAVYWANECRGVVLIVVANVGENAVENDYFVAIVNAVNA